MLIFERAAWHVNIPRVGGDIQILHEGKTFPARESNGVYRPGVERNSFRLDRWSG
jgi:hypothetical protein